MDPVSMAAVVLTVMFCAAGGYAENGKCSDGTPQQSHTMMLLSRQLDGKESLFEFSKNDTVKFTLRPDGSISRSSDFEVDDAALAFWEAVASVHKEVCPSLSSFLDTIKMEQPK